MLKKKVLLLNVKVAFANLCIRVKAQHWPSLSVSDSNLDIFTLKEMFMVAEQEQLAF
jgi:hypothetical protein